MEKQAQDSSEPREQTAPKPSDEPSEGTEGQLYYRGAMIRKKTQAEGVVTVTDAQASHTAGLTLKQAVATLITALVLGLLGSIGQAFLDLEQLRSDVRQESREKLALIRGAAEEAAFQLNPSLAQQVVQGLQQQDGVQSVRLLDNFDALLAEAGTKETKPIRTIDNLLFSDVISYELPLVYQGPGRAAENVGRMLMRLDAEMLTDRFRIKAETSLIANIAQAFILSLILVALFYLLVTRPLLRITKHIIAIDPKRPAAKLIDKPKRHDDDELGWMVDSLNGLFSAFQTGLDERDKAQGELQALTRELEQRVDARTAELKQALGALEEEKVETERAFRKLDDAHKELDQANRLLIESIQYARRIQTSLLPDAAALNQSFQDIAVHWQPLHMVGGDYFWLERFGSKCMIAVIDCTGHGVPGAFMTMVAASALDRILHEQALRDPGEILMALDERVRARLRQDRPDAESDDGMEAAICVWDSDDRTLTFAGAGLPLMMIRNGEVETIRGNRVALGYTSLKAPTGFDEHVITPEPGTQFYLYTDGVPDHMGGEQRRLFGRNRLGRMLQELADKPARQQIDELLERLDAWRGDEPRRDDLTILAFRPR